MYSQNKILVLLLVLFLVRFEIFLGKIQPSQQVDEITTRRRLDFEQSARKRAREKLQLTDAEFDEYLRNATPSKIDKLFNKLQVPKALQFSKVAQKFHGKSGQIWDDWQKTFEAKARYVEPEFRVSNLLEQLADPVRKSIEVHFEAL
eukprot:SAG11_NODE_11897_length_732_cov_6.112164_1_plen_146_part_01